MQSRLKWELVFELKRRWKASAAAILRRAFELRRLDAIEYRRAWKHYMYRRWHLGEPDEPEEEVPELAKASMALIAGSCGISPGDAAEILGWEPETFERIVGIRVLPVEEALAPVHSIDKARYKNKAAE